ncbi:MAG: LysM peptidoglycan-binding domain-containing protein [Flavobacteriaceae bacterium]|nr:LysM peptidoglycan-binding domain-containing protein [Flavobacteriaceae bacterium]
MKKFLIGLSFAVLTIMNVNGQDYKTHKVKKGETIESIAKSYMVTPYDIYALNPDAQTNFKPNIVLIIPKSKLRETPIETETKKLMSYKEHKVRRKETLYSISKKYNIPIEDIKKHNTRLYSENLRKGDEINIPQFDIVTEVNTLENTIRKYTVLPKEGKWRVAYKFGITLDELETLNPNLGDVLQEGQEINVPNIANNEEQELDEAYGYYTVLPKEGFYRLKIKLWLAQEELEALNPELKASGLKSGMVLRIPLEVSHSLTTAEVSSISLIDQLNHFETKQMALLLPFRLDRIEADSIAEAKRLMQKDPYLRLALDFHTGVLMALDSAKQLGLSTKLDVFDTKARVSEVISILNDNDFSNYDAVIGPITSDNFEQAASMLKTDNVPIVSPMTKPENLYDNVFQTIPSNTLLRQKMINYIKADSLEKHIIIISDAKHKTVSGELKTAFPLAKQIFSRKTKGGKDAYYIMKNDVEKVLAEGRNIVFLETANEGFVSNVTSVLNAFNGNSQSANRSIHVKRDIVLATTNKNKAFEGSNISNYDLSNLKFHYPSVNKSYDVEHQNAFITKYKHIYNEAPNRYAIRGFDVVMDVLMRLAIEADLYKGTKTEFTTEYVENKFQYAKKLFGGYCNEAAYIIKYEDLKLIEASN